MVDFSLWWAESGQLFSLCRNLLGAGSPREPQSNHVPAPGGATTSAEGQIRFNRPSSINSFYYFSLNIEY